ncbi:MAG: hypothetical protein KGZ54_11870 [Dethiobacter sp.]|nr:hypothetical protein [Dethiobacter sp.]MBS3902695.1 hypothetical protein [Dethiobacter sp.]MBS3989732.1 hypothetical protein [Dethiobacter sp.]
MTATELLDKLTRSGCQVTLNGEELKVRGALTDDLRAAIREHKPGLIAELQKQADKTTSNSEKTDRQTFFNRLARQLDSQCAACFHSPRLNETIFVIRDWDTYLLTLPENALVFSLRELQNMATQSYTDSELRELAQAKREILSAHRCWLIEKQKEQPAGIEAALKVFPGSGVFDTDKSLATTTEALDKICCICHSSDFWTQPGGGQVCRRCHPQPQTSER